MMRTAFLIFILATVTCFSATAADSPGGTPRPSDEPKTAPDPAVTVPAPVVTPPPGITPASAEDDPVKSAKPNAAGEKIVGGGPVSDNVYLIGAEDVLNISVWHEAELSRQIIVRPDGKITLPLVTELNAAGLTPAQLAANITRELMKVMVSPEVTVAVQQVNSKKFYIQGEVNHTGAFPLIVPLTIMEGLASGGGFRDFANVKKIRILRGTETLKFNYKEVRAGKHLEQNVLLKPGDQIIVP